MKPLTAKQRLQQVAKSQQVIITYHEAKIESAKEEIKQALYAWIEELMRKDKRIRGFIAAQGGFMFLNWKPGHDEEKYGYWTEGAWGGIPQWLKPHIEFVEKHFEMLNDGPGVDPIRIQKETQDQQKFTRVYNW